MVSRTFNRCPFARTSSYWFSHLIAAFPVDFGAVFSKLRYIFLVSLALFALDLPLLAQRL